MYNSWYDVFPEIVMISDKELQKKVVETYDEALKTGGWQLNDIDTIPFTLLIPDTVISYRTHVRTVTRMSMKAYEEWEVYGEKFKLNKDYLLAGALLHDVGKLIEYEKTADGKTQKSQLGKNLRHPFSGCALRGLRPSHPPTTTFNASNRTYFFKKSKTNFSKAVFLF